MILSLIVSLCLTLAETEAKSPNDRPSSKDVIAAALAMQDISLARGVGCPGSGTDPEDTTVGRYLAGWLNTFAESNEGRGRRQWLRATCVADEQRRAKWVCDLAIYMQTIPKSENVVGGWGIRFLMNDKKKRVDTWYMCIGAG
jgi:hypothetical protein